MIWIQVKTKRSSVSFDMIVVKLVLCHLIACVTRDQLIITWASRYSTVVKPLEQLFFFLSFHFKIKRLWATSLAFKKPLVVYEFRL